MNTPTRGRHYDWPTIKAEYVEGITLDGKLQWPSLDDVAKRNNAYPQNVRKRASEESWGDERAAFQRRIEEQRQEERATEIAGLAADFDVAALRVARSGMAVAAARMQELAGMARTRAEALSRRQDDDATTTGTLPPAPATDELRQLARAAGDWYTLGTKALGDTPTVTHVHGSAPGRPIQLSVDADVEMRDHRTEGIISILAGIGVLGELGAGDIGRVAVPTTGGDASGAGSPDDSTPEPLHPD